MGSNIHGLWHVREWWQTVSYMVVLYLFCRYLWQKKPYTVIVVSVYVTTQRCCITTRNGDNEAEKSVGSKGEAGKQHSLEVHNVPLNGAKCVFGILSLFFIINFYCFQLPFSTTLPSTIANQYGFTQCGKG